jgi:hypothetical protein
VVNTPVTITVWEFQKNLKIVNSKTSVTPFANRTFGLGAIASEKDTNVLTWKSVDALLCQNEIG